MNDILEMAQGNLTRVIAVRLRPGTDVLLGLTEACRRAAVWTVWPTAIPWSCRTRRPATATARCCT